MPSIFVRKCLSTLIRLFSSNSTPTFSAPKPSENGRRPTETSTLSASNFSSSPPLVDRKSTRLNSSHTVISYAVFCLKKKKQVYHLTIAAESKIHHDNITHKNS